MNLGIKLISTLLLMTLFVCATTFAGRRHNVPQVIKQPDGNIFQCFASGDEFNHRIHDKDNYTIVQDPQSGYFVYARTQDGVLVPSRYIVGKDIREEPG